MRKYTWFTFVVILVLKNVAGIVCVPLPAFPVYLHMYTQMGYCSPEQMTLQFFRVKGTGSILAICSGEMPM